MGVHTQQLPDPDALAGHRLTYGVGHVGAWGGVLLSGVVFTAAAPLAWILLITMPGALLPAAMVAIFGKRQRRRTLEELAR